MMRSTFVFYLLPIMASYLLGSTMCLTSGTNSNKWTLESDIGTLKMSLYPRSFTMRAHQRSRRSPVPRFIRTKRRRPLAEMTHLGLRSPPIQRFATQKTWRSLKLSAPSVKHLGFHSVLARETEPDVAEKRPPSNERWSSSERSETKPKNLREFEHNANNLGLRIRRSNKRRKEKREENKRDHQTHWNSVGFGGSSAVIEGGGGEAEHDDKDEDDEEETADSTPRRQQLTSPEVEQRELYKMSRSSSQMFHKRKKRSRSPRRNDAFLSSWYQSGNENELANDIASKVSFPSSSPLPLSLLSMTQKRIGEETPFENEPLLRIQSWNIENEPEHPLPFPPKAFRPRKCELTETKTNTSTLQSSSLLGLQILHPWGKPDDMNLRQNIHTWEHQILNDLKASFPLKKSHVELDLLVILDAEDPNCEEKVDLRVFGSLCVTRLRRKKNDLKDFRSQIESIMRRHSALLAPLSVLSHSILIIPLCFPRASPSIGNGVIESTSGTGESSPRNRSRERGRSPHRMENRSWRTRLGSDPSWPIGSKGWSSSFPLLSSRTRRGPSSHYLIKTSEIFHNFLNEDEENQSKPRHHEIKRPREGKVRTRRTPSFRSKPLDSTLRTPFLNQVNVHQISSKGNVQPQGSEMNPNQRPMEGSSDSSMSSQTGGEGDGGGNLEVEHNQKLKLTQAQHDKNDTTERASILGLWIFLIVLVNSFVIILGSVPSWLKGTLYRVGPGIIQVGDSCYNHPFDMLSVVQKYTVGPDPEDVTYRNKIIDSKYRDQAQLGGPITVQTDPFRTKLQR
ncbi:hypothetical protein TCAL_04143 [Tigriopus californicus]|uniref:Uncharacterized protein n=1 Tax=Tigriopus californicus TaxID=6832 RepID=A0A553NS67_TIGCA|nr:hypothetical protein TCAL_04143 [Tigriopus californicus]|eukprot:TCALIF_04143-PA protein Name:"Similar to Bcmo1 Beta,beta-carotene 15,15'-monooxygenase (Rattus norvegicus)" AED:0.40 eAED:0.29 QI:0/0.75/0/1/0.5/0.4/5/0/790